MQGNIDMFGEEAGKTTLGDAFLGQPFIEKRESTVGANVQVMRTGGGPNTNWKELKPKEKEEIIDQVLVRGFLASVESRQQIESTEETKMTSQEQQKHHAASRYVVLTRELYQLSDKQLVKRATRQS